MTSEQKDLLHALTFLYLRHRQNRRALSLIMLATRRAPDDIGLMRTLAYTLIANGAAEEALEVIEQLERTGMTGAAGQMQRLLKARALLHAGRTVEAKALFRQFVETRKAGFTPLPDFGVDLEPTDIDVVEGDIVDGPGNRPNRVITAK